MIISLLFFLFFVIFVFYIPGRYFLKFLVRENNIYTLSPSLVLGISSYMFTALFLKIAGLDFKFTFFLFLALSAFVLSKETKFLKNISFVKSELLMLLGISTIVAMMQATILFRSGTYVNGSLNFYVGTHDPMHHLSLIAEIRNNFPFQNPSFAGESLKNYHYFADLILAGILESLPINTYDLYFRFFPIFISLLFSLSAYSIIAILIKKTYFRIISLILITSGGNFAYFVPYFRNIQNWSVNTFLIDQPFSQILNPQTYIGYSFFLVGSYFLLLYFEKKGIRLLVIAGIILALAFPFKVYAALIAFCGLILLTVFKLATEKNFKLIVCVLSFLAVFGLLYMSLITSYKNGLYFQPGWGLSVMVDSPDRLNLSTWSLLIKQNKLSGNYIGVFIIYIQEIVLYIIGNLGVRTIGFIFLIILFLKRLKSSSAREIYFLSCLCASLLIPITFNQGGSAYDIFQFGHYALMISSIYTSIALDWFSKKIKLIAPLGVLVVLMSVPSSIKTINENLANEARTINRDLLSSLEYLKKETPTDSTILVYPKENLARYVTGVGERRVYISDLGTINYAYGNKEVRIKNNYDFFNSYSLEERGKFLVGNNIQYLFLPSNEKSTLDLKAETVNLVFSNTEATIIKVR